MFEFTGVQQGWQCPICKRVYSPFTPWCYYCGEEGRTKTSTGTGTEYPRDNFTSITTGMYSFGDTYTGEDIPDMGDTND